MLHKSRLTLNHKRLAVRVAVDNRDLDLKDAQGARAAIKADTRTKSVSTGLGALFVEVVLGVVEYLQTRSKEKGGREAIEQQTEDEVYLSSIRYQK